MSKSILVVSTPEDCDYCQFYPIDNYCEAIGHNLHRSVEKGRPHYCPLIDMPEEISIELLEEALKRDNATERAEIRKKRIQEMERIQELKSEINSKLSEPGIREIIDSLPEAKAKDLLKDILITNKKL